MAITLDYDTCMAIGRDAGNHNMREAGREVWNEGDWNIAVDTANRLLESIGYPISEEVKHENNRS